MSEKQMATCTNWEQVFYQDDPEADYEKCYQYCNTKKHAITEKDCSSCNLWEYNFILGEGDENGIV